MFPMGCKQKSSCRLITANKIHTHTQTTTLDMYSSAQGLVTGAKWPSQSLFMQSRRRNANDWLSITRRGSEWNADVMTQTGAECAEPVADRRLRIVFEVQYCCLSIPSAGVSGYRAITLVPTPAVTISGDLRTRLHVAVIAYRVSVGIDHQHATRAIDFCYLHSVVESLLPIVN